MSWPASHGEAVQDAGQVWHEKLGMTEQKVTLADGETKTLLFDVK